MLSGTDNLMAGTSKTGTIRPAGIVSRAIASVAIEKLMIAEPLDSVLVAAVNWFRVIDSRCYRLLAECDQCTCWRVLLKCVFYSALFD